LLHMILQVAPGERKGEKSSKVPKKGKEGKKSTARGQRTQVEKDISRATRGEKIEKIPWPPSMSKKGVEIRERSHWRILRGRRRGLNQRSIEEGDLVQKGRNKEHFLRFNKRNGTKKRLRC